MSLTFDMHIHSTFSDGIFRIEEIADYSAKHKISTIGITDHYLTRKTNSISERQLPKYIKRMNQVKDEYSSDILLLKGLEIDSLDLLCTGRQLPDDDLLNQFDFILFEYITNILNEGVPLAKFLKVISDIKIPCGLAHTDLARAFGNLQPSEIIDLFEANNIFIELNDAYFRPGRFAPFYFDLEPYFIKALDRNIYFTLGSDMHSEINKLGAKRANAYLKALGLDKQILPIAVPNKTTKQQQSS